MKQIKVANKESINAQLDVIMRTETIATFSINDGNEIYNTSELDELKNRLEMMDFTTASIYYENKLLEVVLWQ